MEVIGFDGFDDFARSFGSSTGSGSTVISYGSAFGFGRSQVVRSVETNAATGLAVGAGDLNGDGQTDLAIGAPFLNSNDSTSSGGVYTILAPSLGPEDDALVGDETADDLDGGPGDDTVRGEDGNDTLDGDSGNDRLLGGAGNDTLRGGAGDDELESGSGGDLLIGGEGNDTLTSTDGMDTLQGGVGNDRLTAFVGPADLDGGAGADQLFGSELSDTLRGGDGDDVLNGGFTLDDLADVIGCGAGNDRISGGAGADTIDGGTGNDTMFGDLGDDQFIVDSPNDVVTEFVGQGRDVILARSSVVLGGAEIERVVLDAPGGFRVTGNEFASEIIGNSGSNILIGGGGGDTITGGEGTDYFAFLTSDAPGATRITDFGGSDQIALDDRFFGLGDGSIDVRDVTQRQVDNALASGAARYDGRTGELWVDRDGRRGPDEAQLIAVIEGGGRVGADDFLLF